MLGWASSVTGVIAGFLEFVLGGGAAGEETDGSRINYIVIVLITLAKTTLQAQPPLPSTSDEPLGSFSQSLRPLLQSLKFLLGPLPWVGHMSDRVGVARAQNYQGLKGSLCLGVVCVP